MEHTDQDSLGNWRSFFTTPDHDIFDIINNAIMVAAYDFPSELKSKRVLFTEMLYASKNTNSAIPCERVPSSGSKERNVADLPKEVMEMNVSDHVNDTQGDIEASCIDEIGDEKSKLFENEVLSIKDILDQSQKQSTEVLYDSLRKLQQMNVSVEILKATTIGKSVNALKKHGSNKEVKNLASKLIEHWKNMLNEWIKASKDTDEVFTPEPVIASSKQSVVEDEERGLECPPLEEGVFLDTPINMDLSQVFEGLDEDGNCFNSNKVGKNLDHLRNLYLEETKIPKGHKIRMKNKTKTVVQQQTDTSIIEKLPVPHQGKRLDYIYETSIEKKLESCKRKLHERYEELEKAKRQKTIQVVEFKDLPRQKHTSNAQRQRPGHRQSLMNRISKARTTIRK